MINNEIVNVDHPEAKRWATIVYILQGVSFFVGLTYLAGIVINYLKMSEVRGTWVESHFRWQIKTFWYSIGLIIVGVLTIQLAIGYLILTVNVFWIVYRIVYGWNKLSQGKTVPLTGSF